jgi:hypothetical protein
VLKGRLQERKRQHEIHQYGNTRSHSSILPGSERAGLLQIPNGRPERNAPAFRLWESCRHSGTTPSSPGLSAGESAAILNFQSGSLQEHFNSKRGDWAYKEEGSHSADTAGGRRGESR